MTLYIENHYCILLEELTMITYKKRFLYVCLVLLILGCIACKREARQDAAQTCTVNEKVKTAAGVERPVAHVVIDDKALAAFTKQKVTAAYCVAMGAS